MAAESTSLFGDSKGRRTVTWRKMASRIGPRARRLWRPQWLMIALAAILIAAYGLHPATSRAASDPIVRIGNTCYNLVTGRIVACSSSLPLAPLLNSDELSGALSDGLFAATSAQTTSLQNLQVKAVQVMLADHGLPSTDVAAAQTWGREESLAE